MPEWKHEILKRLAGLKLAPAREAEIVEELSQHLEDRFRELVAGGMGEEPARRVALDELSGGPEAFVAPPFRAADAGLKPGATAEGRRDAATTSFQARPGVPLRDALGGVEQRVNPEPVILGGETPPQPGGGVGKNFLASLWQDLRYGLRMLRKNPGFTAVAVLTLALGIGANTAIFSVVNAVMIRPLPFGQPDRLVQVAEKNDKLNLPTFGASVLNFISWREQTRTFEQLAGIGFATYTLSGGGEPEQLSGNTISPALLHVLGISPIAGREFTEDEEKPGAAPAAMIGEGVWKRRFGGDASIIGRTITLNSAQTTVVGVAPAALNLISGGEIYTPLVIDPAKEIRLNHVIIVVGRLRPGISLSQAQSEMDAIALNLGRQYPEVRDWGIHLLTLYDTFVGPQLKTGLLVLLCAVGLVLLIACANVANLLLARAATRQTELAVRTALGASRHRLVAQMLVESIVLSLGGGAAGLLIAIGGVRAINRALPPGVLPVPQIQVDPAVLWFTLGLAVVTGLLFGTAPAWRNSGVNVNEVLKQAGRGSQGGTGGRLRKTLAAGEVALATVLLIGAGLLIRTLSNLRHVRLGFDSGGLLTFQLAPPVEKYPVTSGAPLLYRSLLDSFRSLPGVSDAAISSGIPFGAGNYTKHPMLAAGQSNLPPGTAVPIDWRIVSPGYFKTMRIPLLRGRDFTDADGPTAPHVLIVSQATAKKFWGDADPLGRALVRTADPHTPFTVVGVVGDVHNTALDQESPALYYPMAARISALMDVVVRTNGPPDAQLPSIRQRVRELDPELALANVRTMEEWLSNTEAQPRFNTELLGIFAVAAMLIAAIGIYGVLAYSVSQRTREIGVRMALGATPRGVLKMVMREGMTVVLAGMGIGVAGAFALGRTMSSLVFGVTVRDPITFAGVAAVLAIVALAACVIPARRATKVEPMVALRYE